MAENNAAPDDATPDDATTDGARVAIPGGVDDMIDGRVDGDAPDGARVAIPGGVDDMIDGRVDGEAANAMWGGRFAQGPAAVMAEINASIGFDRALYREDIAGSRAHAAMLGATGILSMDDVAAIDAGLVGIEGEIKRGEFVFDEALEDIHMNIEARLTEKIGTAAGRLHTARSRNDQVALDFRMWTRARLRELDAGLRGLQDALLTRADEHAATVMPGFTHLQSAQPVTFGHHMMAYVEMVGRDRRRVRDALAGLDECPLGAAALAGTGFPTDRRMTAEALGFSAPTRNSIDTVSDRDFALEYLGLAAILATHLSRLAEEIVVWATPQFGFIRLPDAFSTGSSIMPQKRNPDAAELVRAKTGRVTGNLVALLTVMKGLPLAYSKDMQEDKEAAFDTARAVSLAVAAMTGMVRELGVNEGAMRAAAGRGHATATDLADWLVREAGMPFREAHHVTGRAVALADARGQDVSELTADDLAGIDPRAGAGARDVLSVDASVASRTSFGGTAPARVREQVAWWRERLAAV